MLVNTLIIQTEIITSSASVSKDNCLIFLKYMIVIGQNTNCVSFHIPAVCCFCFAC